MDQKKRFIGDYYRQFVTFSELCARYGVSRRIGDKWLARFEVDGPSGLADRSRRPHHSPTATALPVVEKLLALRRSHSSWGAKKLLSVLARRGVISLPGRSTCCVLLKRHGLVMSPRRRKYPGHPGRPLSRMTEPNAVWTADFCYPLTVADGYSREYNEERPHEALGQTTPSSRYRPSLRVLPTVLREIEYPAHYEVRYVSANGGIRWKCEWVCVTHTLAGESVGLNEVGDGLWDVYFGPVLLGRMDERKLRIEDHRGRWIRRRVLPMSPD